MKTTDESDLHLMAWVEATVAEEAPPKRLRRRLLESAAGPGRFGLLTAALRRFVDLDEDAMAGLLRKVDDAAAWLDAPFPGVRYFHFSAGPAAGPVEAGFVRLRPGALFPRHRHVGRERGFVLDGILHDRGTVYGPGSLVESAAGTEHDYTSGPGRDLIVVSLHGGIELVS